MVQSGQVMDYGVGDKLDCFKQLVQTRRSVRGFKPDRVPADVLRSIFSLAGRSPSNCNTQPWFVEIVSGGIRDRLSAALVAAADREDYTPDYPFDEKTYTGLLGERRKRQGATYYAAMGIERDEKEARAEAVMTNLRFFGAPHAAFLFMPDYGGERVAADIGMYAQTLLLSMQAHGVASCPQTVLGFYAETVREVLGIDGKSKLLFGVSFGYEDPSARANAIRMDRAEMSETTRFHE